MKHILLILSILFSLNAHSQIVYKEIKSESTLLKNNPKSTRVYVDSLDIGYHWWIMYQVFSDTSAAYYKPIMEGYKTGKNTDAVIKLLSDSLNLNIDNE